MWFSGRSRDSRWDAKVICRRLSLSLDHLTLCWGVVRSHRRRLGAVLAEPNTSTEKLNYCNKRFSARRQSRSPKSNKAISSKQTTRCLRLRSASLHPERSRRVKSLPEIALPAETIAAAAAFQAIVASLIVGRNRSFKTAKRPRCIQ